MEGMQSLSTWKHDNKKCEIRTNIKGSVCQDCYVDNLGKRYPSMATKFKENTKVLTGGIIPNFMHPRINASFFRLESFGELNNMNQLANYMNLASKNPQTTFSLWTKEKALVWKWLRDFKKPKNVIFIYSSLMVNEREKLPKGFDKVFTVYDKSHKGKSYINCGEKKCIDCLTCYDTKDRKIYINEVIK